MCGITGFIDYSNTSTKEVLNGMVDTLNHRGPNDRGAEIHINGQAKMGLGHTRLSIIDLSPAGHQPMKYQNLSIVFNGEIYNYREIREELQNTGHNFRSESDTEVILHAFMEWGPKCVDQFVGMFAFVIYDSSNGRLYAFRDRAGVKPFYYYFKNDLFLFASEIKALHRHPLFEKEIDLSALRTYFDFGYIPAPYSIFKNTHKLNPGSILEFDLQKKSYEVSEYWNAADFYRMPKFDLSYLEAKQQLKLLLKSAFQYRMVADVPVGVFLSGGYDSSAVAAILQSESSSRLKTFTIGFEEGINEAPFARETAEFLGTDHHELICTTTEAQEFIPKLPYSYDEPFADSSAIPTMLVSRFARESVTVALSADAGDELFAGYGSYPKLMEQLKFLNYIPDVMKGPAKVGSSFVSKLVSTGNPALKHKLNSVSKALNRNPYKQSADLFRLSYSLPEFYMNQLFIDKTEQYITPFNIDTRGFQNEIEVAMAVDYQSYLQNDILTKVDRATMAFSLEGRDPLVDHRLLEFAAQLPIDYKMSGLTTKRILKDIVHDFIPKKMMNRPKSGFSLPIHKWLQGDLSYLIEEFLDDASLSESGIFNVPFVSHQVELFKKGELHYTTLVWKLLMFQMWYKKWS